MPVMNCVIHWRTCRHGEWCLQMDTWLNQRTLFRFVSYGVLFFFYEHSYVIVSCTLPANEVPTLWVNPFQWNVTSVCHVGNPLQFCQWVWLFVTQLQGTIFVFCQEDVCLCDFVWRIFQRCLIITISFHRLRCVSYRILRFYNSQTE